MLYEITESIAVDGFEIMDKFNPKNLEENVDVFNQALNKYLAEYEKAGICGDGLNEFSPNDKRHSPTNGVMNLQAGKYKKGD